MQKKTLMLLPAIDNHTQEVEIAFWLKADGSHVQKNESICEVNTEEFAFELEATEEGTLKILAAEGTLLKIGEPLCEIIE